MKRHQGRTPLLVALLIAAVVFAATTWIAANVEPSMQSMQTLVAAALVAGVGGLRLIR